MLSIHKSILKGKGKVNHLTDDDPYENLMIMVWLWSSMVLEINWDLGS